MWPLVNRVQRRGLLVRGGAPQDRRAVILTPTPEGKQLADQFYGEVPTGSRSWLPACRAPNVITSNRPAARSSQGIVCPPSWHRTNGPPGSILTVIGGEWIKIAA